MDHRWLIVLFVLFVGACDGENEIPDPDPEDPRVPWSSDLPPLDEDIAHPRGFLPKRSIIHFHSPYSHDACDGLGYVDGVLDQECMAELRDGLCRTSIDLAYLSDHPDYAAWHTFDELLFMMGDTEPVQLGGETIAGLVQCDGGHEVLLLMGIEDELMPLGLDRHAAPAGEEAHDLYNSSGPELFEAVEAAGGLVFQEHPEERDIESLSELQDMGLVGLEIYQLHALLDPDSRPEIYGLDAFGWIEDISPFTHPEATGEPDLLFAAFHQEMGPNIELWEALAQRGPMVGTAATDAHRNVLPMVLRDDERPDGYRRMFRWFSNILLTTGTEPADADEALAAGRLVIAFEAFGTPDGLALWYENGSGDDLDIGGSCSGCAGGTLHLECPTLSPASPRDGVLDPLITATVFRNGEEWQTGCGSWAVDEVGNYRVRVDIVPNHLSEYFGDDPEPYLREYPWIYTNMIRITD